MISRPYDFVRQVSGIVGAATTVRRLPTPTHRSRATPRVQTTTSLEHAMVPLGIPTPTWGTVSYGGRPLIFSLTVAIIHLAALQWIFLRIGG